MAIIDPDGNEIEWSEFARQLRDKLAVLEEWSPLDPEPLWPRIRDAYGIEEI